MKKLLLLTTILLTLSCSKDDDNCECYYYERIGLYANCDFEETGAREALNDDDLYPEDLNRIREYAAHFKCD